MRLCRGAAAFWKRQTFTCTWEVNSKCLSHASLAKKWGKRENMMFHAISIQHREIFSLKCTWQIEVRCKSCRGCPVQRASYKENSNFLNEVVFFSGQFHHVCKTTCLVNLVLPNNVGVEIEHEFWALKSHLGWGKDALFGQASSESCQAWFGKHFDTSKLIVTFLYIGLKLFNTTHSLCLHSLANTDCYHKKSWKSEKVWYSRGNEGAL